MTDFPPGWAGLPGTHGMTSPSTLTRETVMAAVEKIRNAEYTVCVGGNRHVVHPDEWLAGGWAVCAGCCTPVWLGERW